MKTKYDKAKKRKPFKIVSRVSWTYMKTAGPTKGKQKAPWLKAFAKQDQSLCNTHTPHITPHTHHLPPTHILHTHITHTNFKKQFEEIWKLSHCGMLSVPPAYRRC